MRKILDKYILKKFLSTFAFVVLILVSIVLVITFAERNDSFIKNNVPGKEIALYMLSYAPYVANMIAPLTVFIATVFVTSQLASHTEIVAILSGGVSYPRFLRPFMIGAAIIGLVTFLVIGWVIPNANKYRVEFEIKYFDKVFNYTGRNVHFKVSPTTYVYLRSYDTRRDVGYGFTLEEINGQEVKHKMTAREIRWDTTRSTWTAKDWNLREFIGNKEKYRYENIDDTVMTINMDPKDFGNMKDHEQTLTLPELDAYISQLQMRGADNIPLYYIEKLVRYMSPFTAIILTFIGVVLSSRKTRGGVGFQIAIGFVIAFIFIILFVAAKSSAQNTNGSQLLAIWMPNIIFAMLGLLLYRFLPK